MTNRSSRKKLEEELKELNSKIAELSSETGETAIQKLQDEIRVCKNMIKCTVCSDRPKEVTLGKLVQVYAYVLIWKCYSPNALFGDYQSHLSDIFFLVYQKPLSGLKTPAKFKDIRVIFSWYKCLRNDLNTFGIYCLLSEDFLVKSPSVKIAVIDFSSKLTF